MDIEGGKPKEKYWHLRKDYTGKSDKEWESGIHKLIDNMGNGVPSGVDISITNENGIVSVVVDQKPYIIIDAKKNRFKVLEHGETTQAQKVLNNIITTVTEPGGDAKPKGEFEESAKSVPGDDTFLSAELYDQLPDKVKDILSLYDGNADPIKQSLGVIYLLNKIGWDGDYDLSGEITNVWEKGVEESVRPKNMSKSKYYVENYLLERFSI